MKDKNIIEEVEDLYRVVLLRPLRQTPGVKFDVLPPSCIPKIDAIDRVMHEKAAISPGSVGEINRPWYMHPGQDDNLMVLRGTRYVDIYTPKHGKVENFEITANEIKKGEKVICDQPAILVWPKGVFHRIRSGEEGSASVNLATHYEEFDIKTNFSIYKLDTDTGKYEVIRKGEEDQKDVFN